MQQAGVALKPVTIDGGDRAHFYQLLNPDGPPPEASTAADTALDEFLSQRRCVGGGVLVPGLPGVGTAADRGRCGALAVARVTLRSRQERGQITQMAQISLASRRLR